MRRRVLSYGLLALAATAAAGAFAVNRFLDRPGESAFAFMPADAKAVVSIDLVPAPDQVLAFKSIDDMISQASDGKAPDLGSLFGSIVPDPKLKPMADQVGRSAAFVWMKPLTGKKEGLDDADGAVFVALKDAAVFERTLKANGKLGTMGGATFYWLVSKDLGDKKPAIMVHGDYAIVTDKPWILEKIARVIKGEEKAITSDPAFVAARDKALPSANLLILASPEVAKGDDWTCASMAIRDGGIELGGVGQTNDENMRKLGGVAPLGSSMLAALPRGAYGFFAYAQPGRAVAVMGEQIDKAEYEKMAEEMKKETELDMKTDVLPALDGNLSVAFYPSLGPDAGIDLLVTMDDANGANPADLARKLERMIDGKMEEGKSNEEWKVSVPTEGAEVSRLADEPAEELRKELQSAEKSFFRPLTLSKGKTVTWAKVGGSVVFATSTALLDRAIAARKAPSAALGLSGDLAMGTQPEKAADGQFAMAFSMKRLVEGIRNTVDPSHMDPETAKMYRKGLSIFDNVTEPLAIRSRFGSDGRFNSYVSIPFDWSKLPTLMK